MVSRLVCEVANLLIIVSVVAVCWRNVIGGHWYYNGWSLMIDSRERGADCVWMILGLVRNLGRIVGGISKPI